MIFLVHKIHCQILKNIFWFIWNWLIFFNLFIQPSTKWRNWQIDYVWNCPHFSSAAFYGETLKNITIEESSKCIIHNHTYMGNKCFFFREWHKKFLPLLSTTLESHYITTKYTLLTSHTHTHIGWALCSNKLSIFYYTAYTLYLPIIFYTLNIAQELYALPFGLLTYFSHVGTFPQFYSRISWARLFKPSVQEIRYPKLKTCEFFKEKLHLVGSQKSIYRSQSTYK